MNSQDFLTLNVVGIVVFLLWYLLSRGGYQAPTKLNLKAKDTAPTVLEPEKPQDQSVEKVGQASLPARTREGLLLQRRKTLPAPVKDLNVMFNYNGHSWDAYVVLGVPAGASLPLVTEAYQRALQRCDKESVEFLETAYQTILAKK
jgi:hypothetical protein